MALNRNQILKNAQTYLQRNKLDKAIAEYLLIVKEDPKDCRTLLKIAEIRLRKNEVEQACETYNQIAELYAADGFYLKAVAVYKQILKIDPQAIAVYHKLAEVYDQLGLVNDAITQFKTIIDLDFGPDGSLYVLEHATGPVFFGGPGQVVKVAPNGTRSVVVGGLIRPTSILAGDNGELYVSNQGVSLLTGEVLRIDP